MSPGWPNWCSDNMAAMRLVFTADPAVAVAHGQVQFIAVGTPPCPDGSADLACVFTVAQTIARLRDDPVVIVEKSTVPVGTGDRLRRTSRGCWSRRANTSTSRSPRTRSSSRRAPRSPTAGAGSHRHRHGEPRSQRRAARALRPFNRNHDRMMYMSLRSAELTKYAANCLLATKISFINQIAELAERPGRRHRGGSPGHRRRPADRLPLPLCRLRLWRLVLPQGRAGPHPQRHREAARATCCRPWKTSTSARSTSCSSVSSGISAVNCAVVPSPSGAWRSSPIPTTCAKRRAAR